MLVRTALAFLISLPATAQQQTEVKPVTTDAYQKAVQKNNQAGSPVTDSSISSLKHSVLTTDASNYYYHNGSFQRITIKNNTVKLEPYKPRHLIISGTYTGTVNAVSANRQPHVQNEYAQGRSANGELLWRGAETNEPFSFGPRLSALEYDGGNYDYDINGKLVAKGTGKGLPANMYDNSILHTATEWKQRLSINAAYRENWVQKYYTKITIAQNREQLVITGNTNRSHSIGFTAGATIFKKLTLTAGTESQHQSFTNGNRNAFFNRAWQQSLLTPASFSNSQGITIHTAQRSFNSGNDNPLFLLSKTNPYRYHSQQLQFSAEYKLNSLTIKSIYTPSETKQYHNESYQPGTAFFTAGISNNRFQQNLNKIWINSFSWQKNANRWYHHVSGSINNNRQNVWVSYTPPASSYTWKRNTAAAGILYSASRRGYDDTETGFTIGNNFYSSSTAAKNHWWLPTAGAFVRFTGIFNRGWLRVFANTKKLVNEPSLTQSYSGVASVALRTDEAMKFFPVKEVNSFNGLAAERHTQYNAGFEFMYSPWLTVNANVYITTVKDAVFPTLTPAGIALKNMAAYRNTGIEIQLYHRVRLSNYTNYFSNTVSFFLNRNSITDIDSRFEKNAIAGFSNVYKALVKGMPAGIIMGNDYLYDSEGKKIIGADGFPIAGSEAKVIGNPIPDFTMKLTQGFVYKRFSLNLDWEWRQGGDVWNGTRAVLDYYGRSAASAGQRDIKQYVFDGVTESGTPNTTAVDFYDPALPVEQNRWVRYGYSGVAKEYIEKGSFIKLNNASVAYSIPVKWLRKFELVAGAGNIFIWSAYKGVDPGQLLYDQPSAEGLDFFNLPSVKRYSFTVAVQF